MANQTTPAIQVKDSNVGIGTNSPSSPFTVATDVRAASLNAADLRPQSQVNLLGGGGDSLFIGQLTNSFAYIQSSYFNTTLATYPILLNPLGGNVLIGTTTDSGYKLNVNGDVYTSSNYGLNAVGDYAARYRTYAPADGNWGLLTYAADPEYHMVITGASSGDSGANRQFRIYDRPTGNTRFVVNFSNGFTGIGTTAPNRNLHVAGTTRHERVYAYANNVLAIPNSVSSGTVWVHLGTQGSFTTDKIYYRVGTNTSEEEGEIIIKNTCSLPNIEWFRNSYNPMVVAVKARMQGGCQPCEIWIQVRYGSDYGGANTTLQWQVHSGTDGSFTTVNATGTPGTGTNEANLTSTDGYFYETSGNIKAPRYSNAGFLGSGQNNARNHFTPLNAGSAGPTNGWIAAAFGDALADRIVIGQWTSGAQQAIFGAHNANLSDWADTNYVSINHNFYSNGAWSSPFTMSLRSNGNLLIGTSTDSGYKLRVVGSSYTTGDVVVAKTTTANANFGGPVLSLGDSTSEVGMCGGIAFAENLTSSLANVTMGIYYDGKANKMHFTASSDAQATAGENLVAATKHMTITRDTGLVGIGTTAPVQKLDVRGFIVSDSQSNASESAFYLGNSSHGLSRANLQNDIVLYTTAGDVKISANTSAITHLMVKNSGNVLIGTTTDAGYKLDVNGTFRSQGILNVQGGYYENKQLYVQAGETKYLYVDIENSWGNVDVLIAGYGSAGSASCLISWIDGGHGGGTPYHRLIQLARQTQGNPVLGNVIQTGAGGAISIQNTGGVVITLQVTTRSYGNNSVAANAYLSDTAPTGNNASILNIDDINSRVGIGTTAPSNKLHIDSAEDNAYALRVQGNTNNSAGVWTGIGIAGEGANTKTAILFEDVGQSYSRGRLIFALNDAPDQTSATPANAVMTLTPGGNVLIGTTTDAGYKLDVNGVARGTAFYAVNDRNQFARGFVRLTSATNNTNTLDISVSDTETSIYSNYYGGGADQPIRIGTYANLTNQLYLATSGNVGIGTTAPNAKLEVSGSAKIDTWEIDSFTVNNAWLAENVYFDGSNFRYRANGYAMLLYSDAGSGFQLRMSTGTGVAGDVISYATNLSVKPNGNVQIGSTTDAGYKLDVYGEILGRDDIRILNTYALILNGTDANWRIGRNTITDSGWLTGNTMQMVVFGSSSGQGFQVVNHNGTALFEIDGVAGASRFTNALGVGVNPSGTAGRIDASNDIVAYSSSDQRLKENITPIANALDKVKALTGVEFDWKPEHKDAHGHEGHDTGVIAQEVKEVMPTAVRTNDTGFLAVRYEKLIGLLIEAVKEQQDQIDELKAKLNGLTR